MFIQLLKCKLHQACVTDGDLAYEGSLGIDAELMNLVGLVDHEKILVANMNTGDRFETYAIREPAGSRRIVLNGAAARLGARGDRLIIMSFGWFDEKELHRAPHEPRVLRLDENNQIVAAYGFEDAETTATPHPS
ncbi:MAG: Aspartate 1-decarboxylase [Phycisphaerae bacterium]|nr:Aspartate 1-decarboxylase [Phycisphaerae bacterium]